ncbi:MAG: hypothetical protein JJT96_03695 [Opitutales bacterium]|nr:hypothetical protein [Opitutales bacterium]
MIARILAIAALVTASIIGMFLFQGTQTIRDLLTENKTLREAIGNLSHEDTIGFARVVQQETRNGRLFTTLRFVQTDRADPQRKVFERDFEIEGDVVHFDALIVRFDPKLVEGGEARALFIWRRIYGEYMRPSEGFLIDVPGLEPVRYRTTFAGLRLPWRRLFWEEIWELANDPERLRAEGISAAYGNVVYTRVQPGLIYTFKLTASGQVYPEVMPAF